MGSTVCRRRQGKKHHRTCSRSWGLVFEDILVAALQQIQSAVCWVGRHYSEWLGDLSVTRDGDLCLSMGM